MSLPLSRAAQTFPPFSYEQLPPADRRGLVLRGIDVILDIGANEGQYAQWMRGLGFRGRIISFEPIEAQFAVLARKAADDSRWECHRLALGPSDSDIALHIASNPIATSVFEVTTEHLAVSRDSAIVGTERVPMRSLTSLWPSLGIDGRRLYLKADVEGFELEVLRGTGPHLRDIELIELELAITPMYRGAPLISDVIGFLASRGFYPAALEANLGYDASTGDMWGVDGIFRRRLAGREDGAPTARPSV